MEGRRDGAGREKVNLCFQALVLVEVYAAPSEGCLGDAGDALVKLVSVLSQVAWIAQSLLFLMSSGRCVFMGDKVSGLQYHFGARESWFYCISMEG